MPHWSTSNEYPQLMFSWRIRKIFIRITPLSETVQKENWIGYSIFNLSTTHTPISAQSSHFEVLRFNCLFTFIYIYKSLCSKHWYSFELHRKSEKKKNVTLTSLHMPLIKSSVDLSKKKCALIRWIFYWKFFQAILKIFSAQSGNVP